MFYNLWLDEILYLFRIITSTIWLSLNCDPILYSYLQTLVN